MDRPSPLQVTGILASVRAGEPGAVDRLFSLVYAELHSIACRRMSRENPGHTLQPTALVHEAYLRLVKDRKNRWVNRSYFFTAAATAMRRILVERARMKKSNKHGGQRGRVPLDPELVPIEQPVDLIALNDSLEELARIDERKARTVEFRYFLGLTVAETAELLGCSERTVNDDWRFARAWLHKELSQDDS